MIDYREVTELANDPVSAEQIERLERRYFWARSYCSGCDVHELACGTAQGAGVLAQVARSFAASDSSDAMLALAKAHYGDRITLGKLDAQRPDLPDAQLDVLVLFEALYYLADADAFFREARRVLRPGGTLLLATANKDLFDFNPSPYSHEYLGVCELAQRLGAAGFEVQVFGDTPIAEISAVQKLLRPVKNLAVRLNLIPKSMGAKRLLKRLVFGKLRPMPAEIVYTPARATPPTPLAPDRPDRGHKVLFCAARKPA
ncbi:class I SAM-dependent methyltransferase [Caenimonas sedimenti]|nr:class I SAM-dependent methyltransferase [Caenimonas sedimenti]